MPEEVLNVSRAQLGTSLPEVAQRPRDPNGIAFFLFMGRKVYVIVSTINSLIIRVRDIFAQTRKQFEFDLPSFSSFFDASAPEVFEQINGPEWKLFQFKSLKAKPYNLRARKAKVAPTILPQARHSPIRKVSEKLLQSITKSSNLAPQPPVDTVKFGAGIPNGLNSCFLASSLQALRASPAFRTRLQAPELQELKVVKELRKIYGIIEGRTHSKDGRTEPKRPLSVHELADFRKICYESGFKQTSASSQEDPWEFCQFLLNIVGLEQFPVREKNVHNFPFPVKSLQKKPLTYNVLNLQVADADEAISDINELISNRHIEETVERKFVEADIQNKKTSQRNQNRLLRKAEKLKEVETVPVKQTLQLYPTKIPQVIPIHLERGIYDKATGRNFINNRKVTPSTFVDFPLVGRPGLVARYEFISAVTREAGLTNEKATEINKDSGHYAAWTKLQYNGKAIYNEYNAGNSRLHTTTASVALEGIKQNSRLLLYEFIGVVKA